jgi:hypothetical protein
MLTVAHMRSPGGAERGDALLDFGVFTYFLKKADTRPRYNVRK